MAWQYLAVLVVSVLVSALLLPKPENQKPAKKSDFSLPTAQKSRGVPILFGTVLIEGGNIVWAGDYNARAVRERLRPFASRTTVGYKYDLSLLFTLCESIDRFIGYWVDKKFFAHMDVTDNASQTFTASELFGGEKSGGGVVGELHVMFGKQSQTAHPYLAAKDPNMPAYRRVVSVLLNGQTSGGAFLGANTTTFKPWSFLVERTITDRNGDPIWYAEKARIESVQSGDEYLILQEDAPPVTVAFNTGTLSIPAGEPVPTTIYDMNPAHIIHSVLTDQMKVPASRIDNDSFTQAADVLFDEGFGLSYLWDTPSDYETFLKNIADHIDGTLYLNPVDDTWYLVLIRADDEVLHSFDKSNSHLAEFEREAYSELYSRVSIKYPSRFIDQEQLAQETNDALARTQETDNATEQSFDAVQDDIVAGVIATRLRDANAIAKCSGTLEMDWSKALTLRTGTPIFISSSKYNFANLQARVLTVSVPDIEGFTARVTWLQDYRVSDLVEPFQDVWRPDIEDSGAVFDVQTVEPAVMQMPWLFHPEKPYTGDFHPQVDLVLAQDPGGAGNAYFNTNSGQTGLQQTATQAAYSNRFVPDTDGGWQQTQISNGSIAGFDFSVVGGASGFTSSGPREFTQPNPGAYTTLGFKALPEVTANGLYQFEQPHPVNFASNDVAVGLIELGGQASQWLGDAGAESYGLWDDGELYHNGSIVHTIPFTLGAVVGMTYEIAGNNRTLRFYMDGVEVGTPYTFTSTAILVPAATSRDNTTAQIAVGPFLQYPITGATPWPETDGAIVTAADNITLHSAAVAALVAPGEPLLLERSNAPLVTQTPQTPIRTELVVVKSVDVVNGLIEVYRGAGGTYTWFIGNSYQHTDNDGFDVEAIWLVDGYGYGGGDFFQIENVSPAFDIALSGTVEKDGAPNFFFYPPHLLIVDGQAWPRLVSDGIASILMTSPEYDNDDAVLHDMSTEVPALPLAGDYYLAIVITDKDDTFTWSEDGIQGSRYDFTILDKLPQPVDPKTGSDYYELRAYVYHQDNTGVTAASATRVNRFQVFTAKSVFFSDNTGPATYTLDADRLGFVIDLGPQWSTLEIPDGAKVNTSASVVLYYFEAEIRDVGDNAVAIGVQYKKPDASGFIGRGDNGVGYYSDGRVIFTNGSANEITGLDTYTTGDVIGVLLLMGANSSSIEAQLYKNDTLIHSHTLDAAQEYYPAASVLGNNGSVKFRMYDTDAMVHMPPSAQAWENEINLPTDRSRYGYS